MTKESMNELTMTADKVFSNSSEAQAVMTAANT
jgi:hypothetical protein